MSGKSKTIQQKMEDLNAMIAWFDSDEFVIEEAIDRFKSAQTLATEIEKDLSGLKNEITVLKQKFDSES